MPCSAQSTASNEDQWFNQYDQDALNACTLGDMGQVLSMFSARQAYKLSAFLLSKTDPGITVVLVAYHVDRPEILDGLQKIADKGCRAIVYVDKRTSITTAKQWEALARLRNSSQGNVQIMLTDGDPA